MIHYLRHDGKTIVDIEAWPRDLSCVVNIENYSELLLQMVTEAYHNPTKDLISKPTAFITDMAAIQEIRGEFFEAPKETEFPDDLVTRRCAELANKWNLNYVTD